MGGFVLVLEAFLAHKAPLRTSLAIVVTSSPFMVAGHGIYGGCRTREVALALQTRLQHVLLCNKSRAVEDRRLWSDGDSGV